MTTNPLPSPAWPPAPPLLRPSRIVPPPASGAWIAWLAAAATISLFTLLVYASVQQSLRHGANDPQIQIAEDAAAALAAGKAPREAVPTGRVDLARSLAPWVTVLGVEGQVLASDAALHDRTPVPPRGVLDAAREKGENRLTWQPERGVRSAIVVVPVRGGGFVIAGRSLREVEWREDHLWGMAGLTWVAAMALLCAAWGLSAWWRRNPWA